MSGLLAASGLWLGLGLQQSVEDPFAVQRGASLGLGLRSRPWLELRLDGALMPSFSTGITRALRTLSTDLEVHPDLSPVRGRLQLSGDLLGLRGGGDELWGEAGLRVGAGLIHTIDDPDSLVISPGEPGWQLNRVQWHLTPVLGAVGALGRGGWRLETRLEWTSYTELVLGEIFAVQQHCWVGLALGRRLGGTASGDRP